MNTRVLSIPKNVNNMSVFYLLKTESDVSLTGFHVIPLCIVFDKCILCVHTATLLPLEYICLFQYVRIRKRGTYWQFISAVRLRQQQPFNINKSLLGYT